MVAVAARETALAEIRQEALEAVEAGQRGRVEYRCLLTWMLRTRYRILAIWSCRPKLVCWELEEVRLEASL